MTSKRENGEKLVLRNLAIEDFDDLISIHRRSFPGMKPWKREQIESRI